MYDQHPQCVALSTDRPLSIGVDQGDYDKSEASLSYVGTHNQLKFVYYTPRRKCAKDLG